MAEGDKNINDSSLIKLVNADFANALNRIYASRVGGSEDGYALITELVTYIQGLVSDTKAKVSATDTTSNYLASKFVAGTNITLTINNPTGDETITIDGVAGSSEWSITTNVLSNDTKTVDYISLYADNVEVARVGDGVNPKIIVDPNETYGNTTGYGFGGGALIYASSSGSLVTLIGGLKVHQLFTNNHLFGSNLNYAGIRIEVASATNPNILPSAIDPDTGVGWAAANELSSIAGGVEVARYTTTGMYVQVMKSGATQVAAGANAGELWKTSGHATLLDNIVMHGV